MRPMLRGLATLSTALILAACGGSATPSIVGPVATGPAVTTAAAPCKDSTDPTTVSTSVGGNEWSTPVNAKVNDVITWANSDGVPHKVALDDGSCAMSANIPGGGSKSLVFTVAGTYPFHCTVHSTMKGTIVIS